MPFIMGEFQGWNIKGDINPTNIENEAFKE